MPLLLHHGCEGASDFATFCRALPRGGNCYLGNIALSIYVETLSSAIEQESHFLRESDEEYLSSHLFNLTQAESIVDILNEYLENPLSALSLLKFLNDEADCFESMKLEAKEKKQRYVIIIVNALASTLWSHKELQERFIEKCRIRIRIDKATWDSQTSRIRNASASDRNVSQKALQLRDELYEQLGIPSEFRL